MIADRAAYDVGYTDKLSNRFRLQVDARSDLTGRVYKRTETQSTQAWLTKVHEVSEKQNATRPVHAWLSVSKISRSRLLQLVFFPVRFVVKRHILQQKYLKLQIGTYLLGTRRFNF